MAEKEKKINSSLTVLTQITLLLSQFLFLTVLVGSFSFISGESFNAYKNTLLPSYNERTLFSLYD